MNRRGFVALIAGTLASPLASLSQPAARLRRIGFLSLGTSAGSADNRKALSEGLQALGWTAGRNLLIEERFAEMRTHDLPLLIAELLRASPEVIVCTGPAPAQALKKAGASIPVVFVAVADPVGLGLGQSLARPGGNFTGLATVVPEVFFGKQMELFRETVPRARRIAFLTNPGNPIHVLGREFRIKSARTQGFEVVELQAKTREELEAAFPEAARQKADAMYVSGDPLPVTHRQLVGDLALKYRLPTMFLFSQHVEAGGLMSYGSDLADIHRRAASYVDKILKGAKPGDLPIEQPTKFELVINMKTVKVLGLKIPQSVLLRADRVIE